MGNMHSIKSLKIPFQLKCNFYVYINKIYADEVLLLFVTELHQNNVNEKSLANGWIGISPLSFSPSKSRLLK